MTQAAVASRDPVVPAETLALGVAGFAALLGAHPLGQAAGEDGVPKAMRRRMSPYDLNVARCVIGLSTPGAAEDIVLASRYGNMMLTQELLVQLVGRELLSPAKFSMSVHNAAGGIASLITGNRGGHTAVSAGERTLQAGLTEAWTRIRSGHSSVPASVPASVLLVFSDMPMAAPYDAFDEPGDGVQLAIRLTATTHGDVVPAGQGRLGAIALAEALSRGAGGVAWRP